MELQQFEHDRSSYVRPNQAWTCGWARMGHACAQGPTARGSCRATTECQPRRSGDRWHCTRDPESGGPCAAGPLPDGSCPRVVPPCRPVRSQRTLRGRLSVLAALLTVGGLLIGFGGPWRKEVLTPGALTAAHAPFESNCAACHGAAADRLEAALSAALDGADLGAANGRCLSCHDLGPHGENVHAVATGTLLGKTARRGEGEHDAAIPVRLALARELMPPPSDESPACVSCHSEHHGRTADLRAMSGARCQGCHATAFRAFWDGHPSFPASYPTRRRTRIVFNHATHEQYAQDEGVELDCMTCHEVDRTRGSVRTASFEVGCAVCHHHAEQIATSGSIEVLNLPAVDLDALRAVGVRVGLEAEPWPVDALDEIIGMSPVTQLLLAGDPRASSALLEDRDALMDLSGASAARLEDAGRLVWALKELVAELVDGGEDAYLERVRRALGSAADDAAPADLLGRPPADDPGAAAGGFADAVRTLEQRWLPSLAADVAAYRADRSIMHGTPEPDAPTSVAEEPPAAPTDADTRPADVDDEDDLLGDDEPAADDDLFGGDEPAADDDLFGGDEPGADDDLLGGDEPGADDDLLGGDEPGADDDLLGGDEPGADDDLFGDDEAVDDDGGAAEAEADEAADELEREMAELRALVEERERELETLRRERAATARWFLDESTFALRYRPSGHADRFLHAWLDVTGAAQRETLLAGAVFDDLRRDLAPGRCGKCHSVDDAAGGAAIVNWHAEPGAGDAARFTRFDHRPHVTLLSAGACQSCHVLGQAVTEAVAAWRSSYEHGDPHAALPSFEPLTAADCAACHTPAATGSGCLSCHRYHAGAP